MRDASQHIIGKPQITPDAHKPYLKAVDEAFGGDADYGVLHKVHGASSEPETRYSPPTCIGCEIKIVSGVLNPKHVSTSYVERQNLAMRMTFHKAHKRFFKEGRKSRSCGRDVLHVL